MNTIALIIGRLYGSSVLAWWRTFKQAANAHAQRSAPWTCKGDK